MLDFGKIQLQEVANCSRKSKSNSWFVFVNTGIEGDKSLLEMERELVIMNRLGSGM